ncbi:MAG TPA: YjbQ family protein [Crenotrichaceae bacterium]|nr:YjbQ family protein [Crenotrichaceae bacterium]
MWIQRQITLKAKSRGFHLIDSELLEQIPEIKTIQIGLAHFFIQHTSASLAVNENADPTVRIDMENYFCHAVPENESYFQHTLEGADDMPAHIKAVIVGGSLSIPITNGRLSLGVWQGIYLGEHRNHGGRRNVLVTLHGEEYGV